MTERREVARLLTAHLQMQSMSAGKIKYYTDKITSGVHDDWMRQISLALRDQAKSIFAGLEDEGEDDAIELADVRTLLAVQDERDRVDFSKARKGSPRPAKDAASVIRKREAQAKQSPASRENKILAAVIEPYPPCIESLKHLKTIKLAELEEETHHRGSALLVKRVEPLIRERVVTKAVIKDDDGDVENVELHLAASSAVHDAFSSDGQLAIKEPYYTRRADGTTIIRIDHPTDVVLPQDREVKAESAEAESKSAAEWKQVGNDALKAGEFSRSRNAYKTGLSAAKEDEKRLKLDLYRNAARAELELKQFDEAKTDAFAAVSDGADSSLANLDVKAYFRAGLASYNLEHFDDAEIYYRALLELDKNDADGGRELVKVQRRLGERRHGNFDFDTVIKTSLRNPHIDAAKYANSVQIGESEHGGRGLFATRDLRTGDLVLCEKAFCSVFQQDPGWFAAFKLYEGKLSVASSATALWCQTVQKLLNNPSTISKVAELSGKYEGIGTAEVVVDGSHVVDTFQIHDIIERNTFGIPSPQKGRRNKAFGFAAETQGDKPLGENTGLFVKAAYMNHSCVPNTRKFFIGDLILMRATRPISKGEELFQAYVQTDAGVEPRRRLLESTWHFRCNCKLCAAESQESKEKIASREALEKRASELAVRIKHGAASETDINKAEVLLKSVKNSYDSTLYKHLPRKGSADLQIALIHQHARRKQRAKCLAMITDLFDMLGWKLDLKVRQHELTRKEQCETWIVPNLVEVLLLGCSVQRQSGREDAEKLEKIAQDLYIAVNGVPNGWDQLLKTRGP